jgi:hypothetical protein
MKKANVVAAVIARIEMAPTMRGERSLKFLILIAGSHAL